jgi:hypothetical protein
MKILTRKRIGWILLVASVLLGVCLQLFGRRMFYYDKQGSPNGGYAESVYVNLYVPIIAVIGLCLILWRKKI